MRMIIFLFLPFSVFHVPFFLADIIDLFSKYTERIVVKECSNRSKGSTTPSFIRSRVIRITGSSRAKEEDKGRDGMRKHLFQDLSFLLELKEGKER